MGRYKTGALLRGHSPLLKAIEVYVQGKLPTDLPVTLNVPPAKYPILANDRIGDCTIAGLVHLREADNTLTGKRDFIPDEKEAEDRYFVLTGGEDTGLVIANLLHEDYTAGNFHTKNAGYAPASNPRDLLLIRQIVYTFGGGYAGILCPNSAQDQFANGEPWSYVGERAEDGHCIVLLGWTAKGNLLAATWGGIVEIEPSFIAHYFQEVYAVIGNEFKERGGDGRGVDFASLQADLALVR